MSGRAQRARKAQSAPPRRRGVWLAAGLALAAVVVGAFYLRHDRGAPIPAVAAGKLEATAAAAVERRREAVRAAPNAGAAWGEYGVVLRAYDFHEEARTAFTEAERLAPKEVRWPYLHGLLISAEEPRAAIEKLRRAVALSGNESAAPRLRLARLLAEDGQWEEARRQLEELLRAQPKNAHALLALAQAAQALGDSAEALAFARRCADDARTGRAAWGLIAAAQRRLGNTAAAEQAAQRAAAMPPAEDFHDPYDAAAGAARSDPRGLVEQAQKLLVARRLEAAAPLIARLRAEHPDLAESSLLAGRLQLLRKDFRGAEEAFRRHRQIDPQSVNGAFQLGLALLAQQRHAEGLEVFQSAIRLQPNFGGAHFNAGVALLKLGREREAIAPLREAVRHNPENIDSYLLLGDLLTKLGENTEALEILRQARAVNPGHPRLK